MTIPTIMAHCDGVINDPIDRAADNNPTGNEGIKSVYDESGGGEIFPCKTNAAYFNQKWISKTSKLLADNPIRSTKKRWMKGERHLSKMANSYERAMRCGNSNAIIDDNGNTGLHLFLSSRCVLMMVQDSASTEAMKKSLLDIILSFIQNGFHTDQTNDKGETIWNILEKQQTDHQDTISFLLSYFSCFKAK